MKKIFFVLTMLPFSALASNTIQVRGEGAMQVNPDVATVQVEIWSQDKDAKKAQENNAKELNRVHEVVKDRFKIEEKDIQTLQITLNPDYRYDNQGHRSLLGYQARHTMALKFRNFEKLGSLIDSLIGENNEKQGTNLLNIEFGTEKRYEYEKQALSLAVANARLKAETIAKAAGRVLKDVEEISESSAHWEMPRPQMMRSMGKMAMAAMEDAPTTPVSAGQIKITASVIAAFGM